MKKFMMAAVALICMIMSTTVLTSCGSDDNKTETTQPTKKPVYALINYAVELTDDMFKYGDFTVEYYDSDGMVQTEKLTEKRWVKRGTRAKLPAKLGMRLKVQMKPDADPSEVTSVQVCREYAYTYGLEYDNGDITTIENFDTESKSKRTIAGNELADWFTRYKDKVCSYLYVFDANGEVSTGTWE